MTWELVEEIWAEMAILAELVLRERDITDQIEAISKLLVINWFRLYPEDRKEMADAMQQLSAIATRRLLRAMA